MRGSKEDVYTMYNDSQSNYEDLLSNLANHGPPHNLPGLDTTTASEGSTVGEEPFETPSRAPATQALSEVSGNRGDLGTPYKLFPFSAELVPETSPIDAHQRRYIGSFDRESQLMLSSKSSTLEVDLSDCSEIQTGWLKLVHNELAPICVRVHDTDGTLSRSRD